MKNKKIMVISAHPDDLDFGCSGTIATLSKDNKICYVICTSGEKGFKNKELFILNAAHYPSFFERTTPISKKNSVVK